MITKREIIKDLKFCQELMDRLVEFADDITHKDGLYDIENKCFIKEEGDN